MTPEPRTTLDRLDAMIHELELRRGSAQARGVLDDLQLLILEGEYEEEIALAAARSIRALEEDQRIQEAEAVCVFHHLSNGIAYRRLIGKSPAPESHRVCADATPEYPRGERMMLLAGRSGEASAIAPELRATVNAGAVQWLREIGEVGLASMREDNTGMYDFLLGMGIHLVYPDRTKESLRMAPGADAEGYGVPEDLTPYDDLHTVDALFDALLAVRGTAQAEEALTRIGAVAFHSERERKDALVEIAQKLRSLRAAGVLSVDEQLFLLDDLGGVAARKRLEDDPRLKRLYRERRRIKKGYPRLDWGAERETGELPTLDQVEMLIAILVHETAGLWLKEIGERAVAMMREVEIDEYPRRVDSGGCRCWETMSGMCRRRGTTDGARTSMFRGRSWGRFPTSV